MNTTAKLKKLFRTPGLFARDALLNRYPIELSERLPLHQVQLNNTEATGKWRKEGLRSYSERVVLCDQQPVRFPIDIVYTWVDGQSGSGDHACHDCHPWSSDVGMDPARFESNDELRFSLRSLNQYAPWVNKIYIVTNGQFPYWLNTKHPKIKLVRHDEILDRRYLPTFNSHVIESAIHNIPDLSENYIYFNDDVFLLQAVSPSYFFSGSGISYVFASEIMVPEPSECFAFDTPTEWGAKNARALIQGKYGFSPQNMFAHTFSPQLRSVAARNETAWADSFHVCRENRFRAPSDILCTGFLHPHVALLTGKALMTRTGLFYFNVRKKSALKYYYGMLALKGDNRIPLSACLNDRAALDSADFPDYADYLHLFLKEFFPDPSSFELPSANGNSS